MTFAKAQEEFCVRYYWWALEDIRREVHCAYPFLQTFRAGTERRFLNLVEDFSESQVIEMLTALLKRRMKKALAILGEQFSLADDDLCREFFRRTEHPTQQEMRDLDDGQPDKRQLATFKRNLAASLRLALEPSLGKRPYNYKTLTLRYDQRIEGWPVHTWFDLGGRSAQLTYPILDLR